VFNIFNADNFSNVTVYRKHKNKL